MRIPYIKFLETLVIGRLSPAIVNKKLLEANLIFPEQGINEVYRVLRKTYPENFSKDKPPIELELLRELEIEKMYGHIFNLQVPPGVVGIDGAFRILNDPLMYRLITSMALAKINGDDIELIVNGKYNFDYSIEDIVEFLHYFFNVKDWTFREKQAYVKKIEQAELLKFYKLALEGDKDYLLWKLGAAPDKSFDTMLKEMMVDSFYNFKEKSNHDPDSAQKWGTLAVKLTDKIERLKKEDDDKKNMFDEIQFKLTRHRKDGPDEVIEHIEELKNG